MSRATFLSSLALICGLSAYLCSVLGADKGKKSENKEQQTEKREDNTLKSNQKLLDLVKNRTKQLIRVTNEPFAMDELVALDCRSPMPSETPEINPHMLHFVHVFVTRQGEKNLKTGKESYPVATVIVKEKLGIENNDDRSEPTPQHPTGPSLFKLPKKTQPQLFTIMLKREKGYNPECGDWEFIVISGDAKQVLSRGKTDSCMDCHREYKATDFVTRTYMRDEPPAKSKSPIEKTTEKNSSSGKLSISQ